MVETTLDLVFDYIELAFVQANAWSQASLALSLRQFLAQRASLEVIYTTARFHA